MPLGTQGYYADRFPPVHVPDGVLQFANRNRRKMGSHKSVKPVKHRHRSNHCETPSLAPNFSDVKTGEKRRRVTSDYGARQAPVRQRILLEGELVHRAVLKKARESESEMHHQCPVYSTSGEHNPLLTPLFESLENKPISQGGLSRYFMSRRWRNRESYLTMTSNPPASTFAKESMEAIPEDQAQGQTCVICQEGLCASPHGLKPACVTPCGHSFHRSCIGTWMEQQNTCPSCRSEVESTCPVYNRRFQHKFVGHCREEAMAMQEKPSPTTPAWTVPLAWLQNGGLGLDV
eukprot:CAMPEP_0181326632 /NCGR_PEP_ID=MMETSP1101-20121128/21618_1 /TAXON_ID=46948 /ORGANISM="Rhodomonas abbreviata, Strain Caron Lab Isolate" /LENGTH=289 /DNA_ID=CAMNT_0023435131 /DNA_START=43 /DNA_END=912 /DNA_ORIENTATION=+